MRMTSSTIVCVAVGLAMANGSMAQEVANVPKADEQPKVGGQIKRIKMPAGAVTFEPIDNKNPRKFRLSVGDQHIESSELFVGDGKIALKVVATKIGFKFVTKHGGGFEVGIIFINDGGFWDFKGDYWKADELPQGSTYVVFPRKMFR